VPLDATATRIDLVHAAQRCVEEWLNHLCHLDPKDERFAPAIKAYREAIKLRNRLERRLTLRRAS
jgi:hypothetical protein